jgi:carbon storage regulator
MLVLSRRKGESIRVGDDIVITIFELGRDQVRIGISAPRTTNVHREEVYDEIMLANIAAANDSHGEILAVGSQQALDALPARSALAPAGESTSTISSI